MKNNTSRFINVLNRRASVIILYAIYFGNGPRDTTREYFSSGRTMVYVLCTYEYTCNARTSPTTAFFYLDHPYCTRPFCRAELPTPHRILSYTHFRRCIFLHISSHSESGLAKYSPHNVLCTRDENGTSALDDSDDVTFIPKRRVATLRYPLL